MERLLTASTVLSALGSGLIAGAFFAFAAFVLPALSRLPAPAGIAAMQSIIAAVKSPLFLVVFFGTAALAALMGIAATLKWGEPGALYLLIGSLLYLNGPFGVTLLKNLPLNNKLAAVKPGSVESASVWKEFRAIWGRWNHVRWIGALGAATAFIWALVEGGTPVLSRE
ncbi:MAG: anthrone oxygenase family protein [Methyloceanibacter sp.]